MHSRLFEEFLAGKDSLRIYEGTRLIFSSDSDGIAPLLEYAALARPPGSGTVMLDRVVGNAAALLAVNAGCREVYSPLGSRPAVDTLDRHGVRHHLTEIVSRIRRADGKGMCPMEELSLGKEPAEFYRLVRDMVRPPGPLTPASG